MTATTGCYSQYVQVKMIQSKNITDTIKMFSKSCESELSQSLPRSLQPTKSNVQAPKLGGPLSKMKRKNMFMKAIVSWKYNPELIQQEATK